MKNDNLALVYDNFHLQVISCEKVLGSILMTPKY